MTDEYKALLEAIKNGLEQNESVTEVFVDDLQGLVRGEYEGKEFAIAIDFY